MADRSFRGGVRAAVAAAALIGAWGSATSALAAAGPSIDHQPLTSVPANQAVIIKANVVSNTRFAVADPTVYVRWSGMAHAARFTMTLVPGTTDFFEATLPAELVTADFDYYLEAFDKDDNGPTRQGDEQHPFHVTVGAPPVAAAKPAPAPTKVAAAERAPTPAPAVTPAPAAPLTTAAPSTTAPAPAGGLTATASPATGPDHTAGYVTLGAGAACLIAAGVLMAVSLSARSTYLNDLAANRDSQLAGDKSSSNLTAGVAWGALAVGIAGASIGSYLTFGSSSSPPPSN